MDKDAQKMVAMGLMCMFMLLGVGSCAMMASPSKVGFATFCQDEAERR